MQAATGNESFSAIEWRDDALYLLDQRRLPAEETWLRLETAGAVADAIRDMVVRGAPAIGITAAYGVVLAWRESRAAGEEAAGVLADRLEVLAAARPTAVNLAWALGRMRTALRATDASEAALLEEARQIHAEDIAMNHRMAMLGSALLPDGASVVTHCNTGTLATGGYGTALGVIRQGWADGRIGRIYAGETRPWLQGSRLTAWELARDGIPVTLLADSAQMQLFRRERPDWVIVGADRIAANGDVANKIGTYALAVAARHHGAKFMVVAPTTTVDLGVPEGAAIPIEEREGDEVLAAAGMDSRTEGVSVSNPVFDVTPADLIDAIVTERGVARPPTRETMAAMMARSPAVAPT